MQLVNNPIEELDKNNQKIIHHPVKKEALEIAESHDSSNLKTEAALLHVKALEELVRLRFHHRDASSASCPAFLELELERIRQHFHLEPNNTCNDNCMTEYQHDRAALWEEFQKQQKQEEQQQQEDYSDAESVEAAIVHNSPSTESPHSTALQPQPVQPAVVAERIGRSVHSHLPVNITHSRFGRLLHLNERPRVEFIPPKKHNSQRKLELAPPDEAKQLELWLEEQNKRNCGVGSNKGKLPLFLNKKHSNHQQDDMSILSSSSTSSTRSCQSMPVVGRRFGLPTRRVTAQNQRGRNQCAIIKENITHEMEVETQGDTVSLESYGSSSTQKRKQQQQQQQQQQHAWIERLRWGGSPEAASEPEPADEEEEDEYAHVHTMDLYGKDESIDPNHDKTALRRLSQTTIED